jgi:hypothetical protein
VRDPAPPRRIIDTKGTATPAVIMLVSVAPLLLGFATV